MPNVFEKLNLGQRNLIVVLDAPASFEPEIARLTSTEVKRAVESLSQTDFVIAFVTRKSGIDILAPKIIKHAKGDAIVWFAYPKGTSKTYKCDFNRDTGWNAMTEGGFETVRAVAIDEDWSALRFRRSEFVKSRA